MNGTPVVGHYTGESWNICLYCGEGKVPPVRLELTHLAPEASALSTELRGQIFFAARFISRVVDLRKKPATYGSVSPLVEI